MKHWIGPFLSVTIVFTKSEPNIVVRVGLMFSINNDFLVPKLVSLFFIEEIHV